VFLQSGKAYFLTYVIDVGDDALDDCVGVFTLGISEQVGECFSLARSRFSSAYFFSASTLPGNFQDRPSEI